MSERPGSPLSLRTAWLAEPGVWIWEIVDAPGQHVVESCWAAGWVGYDTQEAAEQAGLGRLAAAIAAGAVRAATAPADEPAERAAPRGRLIIVPRSRASLYRALKRSFGDDAGVEVVLDRRFRERRMPGPRHEPDRRAGDRRRRADLDEQLASGRSITVPVSPGRERAFDADARAILVLYCGQHVVRCRRCEQTLRIRWLRRTEAWTFWCPGCAADLTTEIVRHTRACGYWATRRSVARITA